jgi:hypothetical protein
VETFPYVAKPGGEVPRLLALFFWPTDKRPGIATWARGDGASAAWPRSGRCSHTGRPAPASRRGHGATANHHHRHQSWRRGPAAIRQVMAPRIATQQNAPASRRGHGATGPGIASAGPSSLGSDPAGDGPRSGTLQRRDVGTGAMWRKPFGPDPAGDGRRRPRDGTPRRRDAGTGRGWPRSGRCPIAVCPDGTPRRRDVGTVATLVAIATDNRSVAAWPRSGRGWPTMPRRPRTARRRDVGTGRCDAAPSPPGRDPAGDGPSLPTRRRDVGTGQRGTAPGRDPTGDGRRRHAANGTARRRDVGTGRWW